MRDEAARDLHQTLCDEAALRQVVPPTLEAVKRLGTYSSLWNVVGRELHAPPHAGCEASHSHAPVARMRQHHWTRSRGGGTADLRWMPSGSPHAGRRADERSRQLHNA
jgi:hypothetical protein